MHSFVYVLPRSLKNIYTAWKFSGQILFKCKTNRGLKIFPSVPERIPAVRCSLPSNENRTRGTCLYLQSAEFHLSAGFQGVHFCFISSAGGIFIFCTTSVSPSASPYSLLVALCGSSHYSFFYCCRFLIFVVSPSPANVPCCHDYLHEPHHEFSPALILFETGDSSLLVPKACGVKVPTFWSWGLRQSLITHPSSFLIPNQLRVRRKPDGVRGQYPIYCRSYCPGAWARGRLKCDFP